MAEAVCKYCHRPFTYEIKEEAQREREREVCDACQQCRLRWARKKVRRLKERREARRKALRFQMTSARDFRKLAPGEMLTRAELAERFGISERAVQRIEERALARLRSSTELQEAYGKYKQSGRPLMDLFLEQVGMAMRERDETRVMDLQQELFAMWEGHDALRRLGRELDDWLLAVEMKAGWPEWSAVRDDAQSTLLAAAAEMNILIMKAQKALMRELGKTPFAEP